MKHDKKIRNIVMPHLSYTVIGNEKLPITSIRVAKNPDIEKFEVYLINDFEIVQDFKVKDLSIRIFKDENINEDILEFINKKKQSVAEINIPKQCNEDIYKKYIAAMMI